LKVGGEYEDIRFLAFSFDGKRLVSGGTSGAIKIWEWETGREVRNWSAPGGRRTMAIHPEWKGMAFSTGKAIELRDVKTGEQTHVYEGSDSGKGGALALAFDPDGKMLATGGSDGAIVVREFPSGKELRTLKGHTEAVRGLAFSPDGKKMLASAGGVDKTVRLWDVETGEELHLFSGHTERVLCVAISPDGKRIASGEHDTSIIKLWDVGSGMEERTLNGGFSSSVHALAFSPDGKWLASGGNDTTVMLWPMEKGLKPIVSSGPTVFEHAPDCPEKCPSCRGAIDKALHRLLEQENEAYGAAGLAILASGRAAEEPYRKRLGQSLEFFKRQGIDSFFEMEGGIPAALATMFLSEMLLRDPSDGELKGLVARCVKKMEEAHKNALFSNLKGAVAWSGTYISMSTAICLASLATAREAGVEVSDKVLEGILEYLERAQEPEGWIAYSEAVRGKPNPLLVNGESLAFARTSITHIAADDLGREGPPLHQGTAGWIRKMATVERVRSDAVRGHHVPHFLAGCIGWGVYRVEGREGWERLWKGVWRDYFLKAQREDGSMRVLSEWSYPVTVPMDDAEPSWSAAWYLLIAFMPKETLTVTRR
jgi:hypothetical protein